MALARLLGCILGWTCLLGCTGEATVENCADLTEPLARDRCFHEEINALPASEIARLQTIAPQITDAMIRGAAVSGWVADHIAEIPGDQCQQLCQLLEGGDRGYCMRRCSSPHLQR